MEINGNSQRGDSVDIPTMKREFARTCRALSTIEISTASPSEDFHQFLLFTRTRTQLFNFRICSTWIKAYLINLLAVCDDGQQSGHILHLRAAPCQVECHGVVGTIELHVDSADVDSGVAQA